MSTNEKTVNLTEPRTLQKQLLFEGYARESLGNLILPLCILELLIEFFTSKHCLMLYSINRNTRSGKIQFIDSTFCKNVTRTLEHESITDVMTHMKQSIFFASDVAYPFYNDKRRFDTIFQVSKNKFNALLFDPRNGQFQDTLYLPKLKSVYWYTLPIDRLLYSHSLQQLIFASKMSILKLNVNDSKKLKWSNHGSQNGLCCFVNDDENQVFMIKEGQQATILNLSNVGVDNVKKLKNLKRNRTHIGSCASENNNRVYIVGGEGGAEGHFVDYYDLYKNQWNILPNSKYHHYDPLLWTDASTMLYALRKEVATGEIGIIEAFDPRYAKWIDLEKDRQLREAITVPKSLSINNNQYVATKLFTVSL